MQWPEEPTAVGAGSCEELVTVSQQGTTGRCSVKTTGDVHRDLFCQIPEIKCTINPRNIQSNLSIKITRSRNAVLDERDSDWSVEFNH